jgi:hypothetical protein
MAVVAPAPDLTPLHQKVSVYACMGIAWHGNPGRPVAPGTRMYRAAQPQQYALFVGLFADTL